MPTDPWENVDLQIAAFILSAHDARILRAEIEHARAAERQQATAQQEQALAEQFQACANDRLRLALHAADLEAEVASLTQQRDDAKVEIADWQRRNANQVEIIAGFSHDVTEARQQLAVKDAEIARLKGNSDAWQQLAVDAQEKATAAFNRAAAAEARLPYANEYDDIQAQLTEARAQLAEQLRIVAQHWSVIEAQRAELLTLRERAARYEQLRLDHISNLHNMGL